MAGISGDNTKWYEIENGEYLVRFDQIYPTNNYLELLRTFEDYSSHKFSKVLNKLYY